jgi:catechol 2,3-dioxygenase-like lactoylglutathione lyase family enzyme
VSGPFTAVNHVGYVVRNLEAGSRFLVDVLGFDIVEGRSGTLSADGDLLTRRFGVDANAEGRYAFFRLADTFVELLEWTAPDRDESSPLNSDMGGRHLALSVSDMAAATDRLRGLDGVTVREPNDAGYIYCATPFGLEIQLIPV